MTELLLESPRLEDISSPLTSATLSSQAYVLSLASLPAHYAASASSPSHTIDIFDKQTLQGVQTLSGHDLSTTSLKTVDLIAGMTHKSLISSGRDGSVKVWDERSNSHSIKMANNIDGTRALLCCDVSPDGLIVAGGTDLQGDDALILYWDPRQPATPLRTHASTHSDDITALHFLNEGATNSSSRNILLSASSDGLICTSNAADDDEDEAVLQVGNWGCSISQAGWIYTPSGPNVWASSDMETFSTWSNELDLLHSLDIRGPSVHNQRRTWVTDYLITGHNNSNFDQNLRIFVGSNEGDIAMISNVGLSRPGSPWYLDNLWTNGHVGVVRSLLWDEDNNVLVTGGEDSKLNVWSSSPQSGSDIKVDDDFMDVDSIPTRKGDLG